MNPISAMISTLSEADKKKFLSGLKQKNKRNDSKNHELFRMLDGAAPPKNMDVQLYGKPAKGAYHALSKRLFDALVDFIATKNFEGQASEDLETMKYLLAGRVFFEHQQVKLAFKMLSKAEQKAKKYHLYSILNEIYYTQITNAHLDSAIDLQTLIKDFKRNKEFIHSEENLNLFYASIQEELTRTHEHASDVIHRNLNDYQISIEEHLTYNSLYKILKICNRVAHATRNYYAIYGFIEEACKKIENYDSIEDRYLYAHIQVLYYLANVNFRIKEFNKAAAYLNEMRQAMALQENHYFHVFNPQYLLLKNLLFIYTDKLPAAIDSLQSIGLDFYKKEPAYWLDLKLTQVVALFLREDYKAAFHVYKNFYRSDNWYVKKNGHLWVIQKNLLELMLLAELDYLDLLESRLQSFRKKHKVHIEKHGASRVLNFVKLISIVYFNTEAIYTEAFYEKMTALLQIKPAEEDVFVIGFYAWIQSKVKKTKIYPTFLSALEVL